MFSRFYGVPATVSLTAVASSLLLTNATALAQTPPQTRALRWDPAADTTVTGVGTALWLATEAFELELAPRRCRWCNVDPLDDGVRGGLIWRNTGLADTLSNVTGFVLAPLASAGLNAVAAAHEGALHDVSEDTLLMAEAVVVTAAVTEVTKMLVGRERPFAHALRSDQNEGTRQPADDNLSFFSGHTAGAFAVAAAAGTIGTLRGYRWAPLAWSAGGAMAATTAYLRIAADKHWLTDVIAGAVVGAGIGFGIPFLFHPAVDDPSRASSSAGLRVPPLPAMIILW
jgi:membrane-associated phospholipid phosphatase